MTQLLDFDALVASQRRYFAKGETRPISFRIQQLKALKKSILDNEQAILDALYADFKKPNFETWVTEIGIILDEIKTHVANLKTWAEPQKISDNLINFPSTNTINTEPLGLALIIAPWNYPVNLSLTPLVGAISAGNCSVLKPSELTPNTAKVIHKIIDQAFQNPDYICCIEGGIEETTSLLKQHFDFIFFTGSTAVGKIVMQAAAQNLTPVCLELGGKSPCIIDQNTDLKLAAKRIVWGKFLNVGQTCIAPDYVLIHHTLEADFLKYAQQFITEFYGRDPQKSNDFGRIVSPKHFKRLCRLLENSNIAVGAKVDENERYIAPTVLKSVLWDDEAMKEEIFGPILPVITFKTIDEAINNINHYTPKPLALYCFSNNTKTQDRIIQEISCGGVCINDVISHIANSKLPFGGVGTSGMGAYHGKYSFDLFSHQKSITSRSKLIDVPLRYPPYTDTKLMLAKTILK